MSPLVLWFFYIANSDLVSSAPLERPSMGVQVLSGKSKTLMIMVAPVGRGLTETNTLLISLITSKATLLPNIPTTLWYDLWALTCPLEKTQLQGLR